MDFSLFEESLSGSGSGSGEGPGDIIITNTTLLFSYVLPQNLVTANITLCNLRVMWSCWPFLSRAQCLSLLLMPEISAGNLRFCFFLYVASDPDCQLMP